ncbi:MAG TPA: transposase [Candidatus Cloacimonadota bacterium]|nr:transposase [Candidatus Cloacimonadota bacterium]HPT72281.1 transposase [Candidatus Cloacimonadota bacterium]
MHSNLRYKKHYQGDLPHYQPKESTVFITFRLDVPCPAEYFHLLKIKKNEISNSIQHITKPQERNIMFQKKLFAIQDSFFDKYEHSGNFLLNRTCAQLMATEIHHHNKVLYDLYAYTIMPNHIHLLIKPLHDETGQFYSLSKIMHLIKGRSSRFINLELKRSGKLWQDEYYDHYVRNETELNNIIRYIILNPFKAGFVEQPKLWEWTWVIQEFVSILDDDYMRESLEEYTIF